MLEEDDSGIDPIGEEVQSILDGHIRLSRKMASANRYPAVDVLASVSRLMSRIASEEHQQHAAAFRELLAKYQDIELLVQLGEYQEGNDALGDRAKARIDAMQDFVRQPVDTAATFESTLQDLQALLQ